MSDRVPVVSALTHDGTLIVVFVDSMQGPITIKAPPLETLELPSAEMGTTLRHTDLGWEILSEHDRWESLDLRTIR